MFVSVIIKTLFEWNPSFINTPNDSFERKLTKMSNNIVLRQKKISPGEAQTHNPGIAHAYCLLVLCANRLRHWGQTLIYRETSLLVEAVKISILWMLNSSQFAEYFTQNWSNAILGVQLFYYLQINIKFLVHQDAFLSFIRVIFELAPI